MWPWLWLWAPMIHFPFSGAVRQVIAPETDWFFGRIRGGSGDPGIERRIFEEVASYGKQIGLISEVVTSLGAPSALSAEGKEALARLSSIGEQVAKIKDEERRSRRERLKDTLLELRASDQGEFRKLMTEVQEPGTRT